MSDFKPYLSQGAVIIVEQETIKFQRTRASKVIIEWIPAEFTGPASSGQLSPTTSTILTHDF